MSSNKYVRWALDTVLVGMLLTMLWVANGCTYNRHIVHPDNTTEDISIDIDGEQVNTGIGNVGDIIKDVTDEEE